MLQIIKHQPCIHPEPRSTVVKPPWLQALLRKVASWLKPGGQAFIHIFCHRTVPYHFEARSRLLFPVRLWLGLVWQQYFRIAGGMAHACRQEAGVSFCESSWNSEKPWSWIRADR